MRVYADNAATTKLSAAAKEAMLPYFDEIYGNPSTLYTLGQEAAEHLLACRTEIAQLIGAADPREIVFTSGGSEADNQAIVSAAENGARKGKKHLISTKFEHHAVLHTLDKLRRQGFEVTLLDVHEDGIVRVGIPFHTDAVQAIGHVPVNVQEMNIDMLSCSAHKFHGPRGVGFLYARRGIPLTNIIEGGAQERGKRGGTENTPAIAGMTAALREAVDHMDENMRKVTRLRETLITGLETIVHARLNGDRTQRVPGTVNFCFEGIEGESLLLLLDRKGIAASSGSACTSGSLDPSHVLLALGLPHEVAHGSLRLSVGEYNTDEEMAYIVENVRQVVDYLRSISPVWDELETGVRPHQI